MKTITFIGVPSGDYESFCWDVDKETFYKISRASQDLDEEDIYQSLFYKDKYRLYTRDIISYLLGNDKEVNVKVTISMEYDDTLDDNIKRCYGCGDGTISGKSFIYMPSKINNNALWLCNECYDSLKNKGV